MIHFPCPCGKALQVGDEQAGRNMRCPDCGREVAIPGGEGVQTAYAPRAAGSPPDEDVRTRPDRSSADRNDRPLAPTTSRLAVASLVLGLLSLFLNVWTTLPAIVLGIIALWDIAHSERRRKGNGLAIAGIVGSIVLPVLAFLFVMRVRQAANLVISKNNLVQISLAMETYKDLDGSYPPAAVCDPDGKPLLSWRVAILPYIDQGALFQQVKWDEPWDGPNNSKLLSQMPKQYAMPGDTTAPPGYTYYRVFVGNGAAFDPPRPGLKRVGWGINEGPHVEDFTDGLSHTILVVEAGQAVPWTKPEELDYDPNGPLPPLGGHLSGGFQVLLGYSSGGHFNVKLVTPDVSEQTLRAAITRSGGEAMPPDW